MVIAVTLLLFYFLTPILIIYLTHISNTINKIGAVVMAYGIGLLGGNIGLFPRPSEAYKMLVAGKTALPKNELMEHFQAGAVTSGDLLVNQVASTQDLIMTIVIPLAIPLLLFSLDLRRWLKLAREAMKSLILGVVSLLIVIFAGYFLLGDHIPESWKVAGMLVGVYTGGTPNMVAISTALDVSPNLFVLTNTYDLVLGALALIFLITVAQRLFNLFLPHFNESHTHINLRQMVEESEGVDNYLGMLTRQGFLQLMVALALSAGIFAIAGGLSLLVSKNAQMATQAWLLRRRSVQELAPWLAFVILGTQSPTDLWLILLLGLSWQRGSFAATRGGLSGDRAAWWLAAEFSILWGFWATPAAFQPICAACLVLCSAVYWRAAKSKKVKTSALSASPLAALEPRLRQELRLACPAGFVARVLEEDASVEIEKDLTATAPAGFRQRLLDRLRQDQDSD